MTLLLEESRKILEGSAFISSLNNFGKRKIEDI